MMLAVLLFAVGFCYGSFVEFFIHKKFFHDFGKKRDSLFAFHLREHHLISRRNNFYDLRFSWREALGMPLVLALHLPVLAFSIPLYAGMATYGVLFLIIHNMLHRYPSFAKRFFWWHWNHHMKNQNKSYNVVLPIADLVFRTLENHRP